VFYLSPTAVVIDLFRKIDYNDDMNSSFSEIGRDATYEAIIERSRFICSLKKVSADADAREYINKIKNEHPFATHNCYAYVVDNGGAARFSDDGEPQGTAGQPMLEVLKNNSVVNVVAVVTRYFGGVKLGAGGLVRAYSGAVSATLKIAGKIELFSSTVFTISFNYDAYSAFTRFAQCERVKVLSTDFGENVVAKIAAPDPCQAVIDELRDALNGKLTIEKSTEGFYAYE